MYGTPIYLPIDEKHPTGCNNPYAYSKKLSEDILYAYHKLYGIDVIILRPMNIYGKGMANGSIIDLIVKQANLSDEIVLRDLSPKRDYLHVDDLCFAIIKTINNNVSSGFNIFNLGYGVSYSVLDVIVEIGKVLNRNFSIKETGEIRINEILDCYADISKFSNHYKWIPKLNIKDGLLKTLL
jgi:UDP-glucose 4-epimerase